MACIVLIDDEDMLRGLFAEVLDAVGHRTVVAASGEAGIEAVRKERPDLVLCDVNMPGADGYAVLGAIRADPQLASIPFLFLTGLGERPQVRAGMASGADDYLTKPIAPDELVAAVEARLRRSDAHRQDAELRVDELRRSLAVLLPHELRTPLTAILGCSQMIRELHRELPPEQIDELAAAIVRSAQRLYRMAESYILYADLEVRQVVRPEAPPLPGAACAAHVREAAAERAQDLERTDDLFLETEDVAVPIAAPYLRKLVSELTDNALKFSSPGAPVRVSLRRDGASTELEIRDSGRGMTAQQIREVAAFRQFDRAFFEQQGSGLGLALARRLVEACGGRFGLESEPGSGTRASARWPL